MTRIRHWDIIKGIAIILVILGHATELSNKGSDLFLHSFIYSFHMPLFMIVSGALFSQTLLRRTTKDIVIRKSIQLVLPIIIIGVIEFFVVRFDASCSIKENLYFLYATLIRTLWFLQALFCSSILVLIGERFMKSPFIFYIVLLLLFVLTPDIMKSAGAKFLFPCFLFGTYMNRLKWDKKIWQTPCRFFFFFAVFFAVLLIPFDHNKTIYVHSVYIFSGDSSVYSLLSEDIYRVIIGIAGSLAVISLVFLLEKAVGEKRLFIGYLIEKVGRHTLGLYVAHLYLFLYLVLPYLRGMCSSSISDSMIIFLGFILLIAGAFPLAILIEKLLNLVLTLYSNHAKS